MFSMSSSAHNIETSLDNLNETQTRQTIEAALTDFDTTDDEVIDFLGTLDSALSPLLHLLEETPTRAIILTAVVSKHQLFLPLMMLNRDDRAYGQSASSSTSSLRKGLPRKQARK